MGDLLPVSVVIEFRAVFLIVTRHTAGAGISNPVSTAVVFGSVTMARFALHILEAIARGAIVVATHIEIAGRMTDQALGALGLSLPR